MGPDDAPDGEMRRHQRNTVPALDPVMVERLLDDAVHPDDVPPDYRDVLRVLSAAAAPSAADPAAEQAARAAFRSVHRPADTPRRTSVLSKLLGAKALTALALGAASIGTAAAATGTLPDAAQAAAHRVVAAVPDAEQTEPGGDPAAAPAPRAGTPTAGTVGLCRAYAAGQGGEKGGKLDAAAFERLAKTAGGADKVTAYCATITAPGGASAGSTAADAALAGHCRAWLAAERAGVTARLGKPVLDLLAKAAGGSDSIAAYCTTLVAQAPADQRPDPAAGSHPTSRPTEAPAAPTTHGSAPSPSRPAPPVRPTPTPRG